MPVRLARDLAAASLAAASILPAAHPSWGAAEPQPGQSYVALGSSFAAGGAPAIIDFPCGRSENNYPHLVARKLGLELTDVTCGGATLGNILDTSQGPFTGDPRAPQIDSVHPDTDLVTITAGGNDINYVGALMGASCAADPTAFDVIADPDYKSLIMAALCGSTTAPAVNRQALDNLENEWVRVLKAIRQRAPQARIVILDYVTLLPQSGQGCGAAPLSPEQSRYFLDIAKQLQLATKKAAQRSGVELVELSKASRDHHACAEDPWVTGWDVSELLTGGSSPWHPNATGVQATAELLLAHLAEPGRTTEPR